MKSRIRRHSCIALLALGSFATLALAAGDDQKALDAAAEERLYRATRAKLEQANTEQRAGNCDAAAKIVEKELFGSNGFQTLGPEEKYYAVWISAYCAEQRKDFLRAHEGYLVLTATELADVNAWVGRASASQNLENWDDALLALTTVAKRWPDTFKNEEYLGWATGLVLHQTTGDASLRSRRIDLMNAMFESNYTLPFGRQPSEVWLEIVADAMGRHDLARARAISKRITDNAALVQLNVDRRFDELVAAEPSLRDVLGATKRENNRLSAEVAKHPRSLELLTSYCVTLYALGDFEEILRISTSAIEKVEHAPAPAPPFDDIEAQFGWMYELRARALAALGKQGEGAKIRESWNTAARNSPNQSSDSINLAFQMARAGNPKEALHILDGVDWANGLMPYGRMQLQGVRLDAFLQLGRKDDVETVLAWIREHQQDAPATAQTAFLLAGDLDSAAMVLRSRLENPTTRGEALASLQRFKLPPGTPVDPTGLEKSSRETFTRLMARPDVVAALDKYGRRLSFPIYRTWQ